MTAEIHNNVYDAALAHISTNTENLYICSVQPTTWSQVHQYKVGTKATPAFGSPADGDVSGRKIPITAISDGVVNATGTAGWVVLADDSETAALIIQALASTQAVTQSNTFTLTTFDVELPDPAA